MAAIAAPTIPVPSRVTVVVLAVAVIVLLRSLGRSRAVSSLLDRGAGRHRVCAGGVTLPVMNATGNAAAPDLDAVREALHAKESQLLGELAQLETPEPDQGGISFGKRVGDGTAAVVERLSQVAAHDGLQETLADVRRALDTVDDGTWGFCDRCGQPIPAERLEVRPWSTLCLKDAAAR